MNGLILSAGLGKRLQPITDFIPKPLLPIVDRPAVEVIIKRLQAAGIKRIGINLFHHAPKVKEVLRDIAGNLDIAIEKSLRGTGGALTNFPQLFDDELLVHNCDVLSLIDLNEFIRFHRRHRSILTLGLTKNPGTNYFGLGKDMSVESFQAADRPGHYTYTGIAILSSRIRGLLPRQECFSIIDDVYKPLIEKRQAVLGCLTKGFWTDIGTPERYWTAIQGIMHKRIAVEGIRIASPIYVHASSRLGTKKTKGFVVVGANCRIEEEVFLEDTIVFPDSHLRNGRFQRCILSDKFCLRIR